MDTLSKGISQEIIKTLQTIRKYGKSKIAADAYRSSILSKTIGKEATERSLALASLMGQLASKTHTDEWYIAGLLNDIMEIEIPGIGKNPVAMKALMARSHISLSVIYAVENYRKIRNPKMWNPLMTALNFADTHIEGAEYITTEECCKKKSIAKRCNECMYARHIMSHHGQEEAAEIIIMQLQAERKDQQTLNTDRKEKEHGIRKQGHLEEGSKKANACASG